MTKQIKRRLIIALLSLCIVAGLIWLFWPRSFLAQYGQGGELVHFSIYWSDRPAPLRTYQFRKDDPAFGKLEEAFCAVSTRYAGLRGKYMEVPTPPLYHMYWETNTPEGDLEAYGNADWDSLGNLYMGKSRYQMSHYEDLLAFVEGLPEEKEATG